MTLRQIGIIAAVIGTVGLVPYVIDVLRQKIIPNRGTWWSWTFVGLLMLVSYERSGKSGATIYLAIMNFVGPFIVALLSLWHGEPGWTTRQRNCIVWGGASAIFGIILNSPRVTLYSSLVIDLYAAWPTIRKARRDPRSESLFAWLLFAASNLVNLFVADRSELDQMFYTTCTTITSSAVCSIVVLGRWRLRRH